MAKTWLRVVIFIVAVAIAATLVSLWQNLRPDDDQNTVLAVGVVSFIASFISLYFMTKGGGD